MDIEGGGALRYSFDISQNVLADVPMYSFSHSNLLHIVTVYYSTFLLEVVPILRYH